MGRREVERKKKEKRDRKIEGKRAIIEFILFVHRLNFFLISHRHVVYVQVDLPFWGTRLPHLFFIPASLVFYDTVLGSLFTRAFGKNQNIYVCVCVCVFVNALQRFKCTSSDN